jgi:CubicO group peptidase (beta-lactamase class C family)
MLPDYAGFAQMLVNGGELDGVQLPSPTTVAMMETNQAPAEALPYGFSENDLYHTGYGYGIGMRVLMDVAATGMAGSVGEFGWDGAFSTYFWIDRHKQLFGVLIPRTSRPVARHQGNYSESHPTPRPVRCRTRGGVRFAADVLTGISALAAANTLLWQATGQASRALVPKAHARFPA